MLTPFVTGFVLADCRFYLDGRSAEDAYRAGHLPGAVFVDLERWLAAPSGPAGRHPLPSPEVFAEGMSACGIGDGSVVVAYDDAGGVIAARLVWMLRAVGHQAALLDGGLGGPLTTEIPPARQAVFTPKPWPAELLADIDDVGGDTLVLDARPADRFHGRNEVTDPRAGHIPGAVSVPCRENVSADGTLKPVAQLREVFAAAGVTDAAEVISSCGSGVTACHNLLAMEQAGLGRGRLYPGSWSEYAATDRPLEI